MGTSPWADLIASRIPPGLVSEALGLRLEAPGLKARGYRAVRHEGDSVLEEGEEEEGDEGTRPGELPGGGAHSLSACVSHTPPHTACHWRGPGGGRAALGRPGRLEAARAAAASHMLAMFHFQASRSRISWIFLNFLDFLGFSWIVLDVLGFSWVFWDFLGFLILGFSWIS